MRRWLIHLEKHGRAEEKAVTHDDALFGTVYYVHTHTHTHTHSSVWVSPLLPLCGWHKAVNWIMACESVGVPADDTCQCQPPITCYFSESHATILCFNFQFSLSLSLLCVSLSCLYLTPLTLVLLCRLINIPLSGQTAMGCSHQGNTSTKSHYSIWMSQ